MQRFGVWLFLLVIGLVLIILGIRGKLGSALAALVAPQGLIAVQNVG